MREIKFRCWNTGKRLQARMYSWEEMLESLSEEFNPAKSLFAPFINSEQFKKNSWITLMQYTGLKDKNGKEIYEGDIALVEENEENPPYPFEVIFNNAGFLFKSFTGNTRLGVGTFFTETKVIGNIYEGIK